MKQKTILILGDSTSMSIGAEQQMYPFHLANMRCWAEGTKILNCSLPGFTSADACAFFFRNKKRWDQLAAVVIYLGNCDAISSELRKGKYTRLRQYTEPMTGGSKPKTKLKNRLLHFKWNNDLDQQIESPELPKDYAYNISRIIFVCQGRDISVTLVLPEANGLFPPGVGKGNFVFYKYLGLNDHIADRISIEDLRFKEALLLHERRQFNEAIEAYKTILAESGPLSSNLEYQNVVVNNYAVCAAQAGFLDEAQYLFDLLRKEKGVRREIIFYNLAQVAKFKGDKQTYEWFLNESYEADESMYRIRSPYKAAIEQVSRKFDNVDVVRLKDFVDDSDFVDHCHPLPEIQKLIAKHIAENLQIPQLKGDQPLMIENQLTNPEYALGNLSEFHTYFKSFAPLTSEEIKKHIVTLRSKNEAYEILIEDPYSWPKEIPQTINMAFQYYLKHPCFPGIGDAIKAKPILPLDVGRFPEYFLFRYLVPYLREVESTEKLSQLFSPEVGILRKAEEFERILPQSIAGGIERNNPVLDLEYERVRLPAILEKVKEQLVGHLKQGNQVHNNIKTTNSCLLPFRIDAEDNQFLLILNTIQQV